MGELRAGAVTVIHVVVPGWIDDPARPSGGNTYDRMVCQGLAALGWSVDVHPVPGAWPTPDREALSALAEVVAGVGDGDVVLLDGLLASVAAEVLVPEAGRVREVVLVHLPIGHPSVSAETPGALEHEREVLTAAAAVVTPSLWARQWLLDRYGLRPGRVHVAEPGVEGAQAAPGTPDGGELLCVGAVARHKGHDLLLAALRGIDDLAWRCTWVGSLEVEPVYAAGLQHEASAAGLGARVVFAGPRTGAALDRSYAEADLLVVASRTETYGIVVTEALSRGLPVVAPAVGGIPEALGATPDGSRPGLLVTPRDPVALAGALRCWLDDPGLRVQLRAAAHDRRDTLPSWSQTTAEISRVLLRTAQ